MAVKTRVVSTPADFEKNMLSTFSVFSVFNDIAFETKLDGIDRRLRRRNLYREANLNYTGVDDDVVLFVEDDAIPVHRFRDKYEIFYNQLESNHPNWDMAWLGTCLGLHRWRGFETVGGKKIKDHHAPILGTTRCFNAVLFKRSVAVEVMKLGRITDEYLPIDHLFNRLILKLKLQVAWAMPPLFYEGSKALEDHSCEL